MPLVAKDVSSFARSLGRELEACDGAPGHVQLLNMLTRSAGYRNYQHFRAQAEAGARLDREPPAPEPADLVKVERIVRYFDTAGRLVRWPKKASHRLPCLWALWIRFPAGRTLSEAEVNGLLEAGHLFGDPALLRRAMVDAGLATRTADCRQYRRVERRPPAEAQAVIRRVLRRTPRALVETA